jgi:hypothetical protein
VTVLVALGVAGASAACTTPQLQTGDDDVAAVVPRPGDQQASGQAPANGAPSGQLPGRGTDPAGTGVDLVPLHIPTFIFGEPTSTPVIQVETKEMVARLGTRRRLEITGLPSAEGTPAVDFLEHSPPGHRWGEVMFPAERALFRAFARDRRLGEYLVVLTDVDVNGTPDPIPLTAYRWDRRAVESYDACGIPDSEIDACTTTFYAKADTRIINGAAFVRGA